MKKILLSSFLILTFFIQANAQHEKKFNFGFKVAPAISWLGIDDPNVTSNGSKIKFNWGFIGAYNFTENFALVSGFNINSFGGNYKVKVSPSQSGGSQEIRCNEFQIPVLFQMKTKPIGNLKVYAQLGLGEGAVMRARDKDKNNISSNIRTFNTAYILGAGILYKVAGEVELLGQLKFNGGLTNISKSFDSKNNFIELGIGVLF